VRFRPSRRITSAIGTSAIGQTHHEDSQEEFLASLGNVVRSKGLAEIADKAGVSRQSLYRALSPDGNPPMETVRRVLKEAASSRNWDSS
jgi:probable addiction module antidote protein